MKICSLLPSGTEIAFALGLGDQVVGVTDICDYPPEAAAKFVVSRSLVDPSVLSSDEVERRMKELAAEGRPTHEVDAGWLERERPDLVLTQDVCALCDVDASQVREAVAGCSIHPNVVVLSPRTISGIFASIREVGQAAGVSARAESLVSDLQARLYRTTAAAARAPRKPEVFSLEGVNPLVAGGHWIPEMKLLAGGRDRWFSPGCPAARLEWSQVLEADPEVLLLTLCSSDLARGLREAGWLADQEGWWDLRAVRSGEVYMIEHVYFSRPGPRVVDGIEILAQLMHPDLFSGLVPPETVLKLEPGPSSGVPGDLAARFRSYPTRLSGEGRNPGVGGGPSRE